MIIITKFVHCPLTRWHLQRKINIPIELAHKDLVLDGFTKLPIRLVVAKVIWTANETANGQLHLLLSESTTDVEVGFDYFKDTYGDEWEFHSIIGCQKIRQEVIENNHG